MDTTSKQLSCKQIHAFPISTDSFLLVGSLVHRLRETRSKYGSAERAQSHQTLVRSQSLPTTRPMCQRPFPTTRPMNYSPTCHCHFLTPNQCGFDTTLYVAYHQVNVPTVSQAIAICYRSVPTNWSLCHELHITLLFAITQCLPQNLCAKRQTFQVYMGWFSGECCSNCHCIAICYR